MDKNHAEEYYYFGEAFFESIHRDMKDNYEGKSSLAEIRKFKRQKLGCELLIINLIDLETESNDIREICGLIDKEGHINQKALSILQQFVSNDIRSIK